MDIYDRLTPVSLAHWIKGDGSRHRELGLKLHTDSFTPQDIVRLMNCLLLKFNIKSSLMKGSRKDQWVIYIKRESMSTLTK